MKNLITSLLFGKDSLLSGLIAIGIVSLIVLGCTCGKNFDLANVGKTDTSNSSSTSDSSSDDSEDTDLPDKRLLKALVAETTADFAAAISTEDFTSMHDKASSDFQSSYSADQMKDEFREFLKNKKVILPILAKTIALEPEYSPDPYIRTEQGLSILVVNGKYKTKPVPMNFEYEYVKRNGSFKLLKLVIKLK
ncbi:MAG TPA: hypothetical protein VGQ55_16235 [Pyrinomonadaceae bacterium]|jgi:hypothetical protein|nr:hypothetical protein [Pyrinomonadaceae bacterium]